MNRIWMILAIFAFLLAACGPEATPTMSPEDIQGTALAAASTMIAETQAAIPTATAIPPTETPTPTLPPTKPATAALGPTFPVNAPTFTPLPTTTNGGGCNQPLTKWDGDSVKLIIRNNTKPKGLVTVSLFFTTDLGQCGYIGAQFDNMTSIMVPVGTFSAGAFVDGKKDFKVFGGGRITPGSWSLWIENESIILRAGCAPNC
jgi:hypothetical protein